MTEHTIVVYSQEMVLTLKDKENVWVLNRTVLVDSTNTQIDLYVCYRNLVVQWVEGSKGCALSRFSHIIPNEIANP